MDNRQNIVNEILENFKGIEDDDAMIKMIQTKFPGFIYDVATSYSDDYPRMTDTWKLINSGSGMKLKLILIINKFPSPDTEPYLFYLCDILTKLGFSLKQKSDVQKCVKCGKVIVSKIVYKSLKNNMSFMKDNDTQLGITISTTIPETWSEKCSEC